MTLNPFRLVAAFQDYNANFDRRLGVVNRMLDILGAEREDCPTRLRDINRHGVDSLAFDIELTNDDTPVDLIRIRTAGLTPDEAAKVLEFLVKLRP